MLFSLGQPISFAGFVVSFLIAVAVRATVMRLTMRAVGLAPRRPVPIRFHPRRDFDVFGVVAALIGGPGWGKGLDVDEVSAHRGRGRRALVYGSGPLSVLLLSQVFLLIVALGSDRVTLYEPSPVDVRGGVALLATGDTAAGGFTMLIEFLAAIGVGLFCFALFDLIPLPPLDGWGLLWSSLRQPGSAAQTARTWLVENNLGVAILLALMFLPFSTPLVFVVLDVVGAPLLGVWAW
ncbi:MULTISPECIES: M50 family metallopeptidase [Catenuloplanes]|uniref:Zn-dependent protease n=1 Tax=Catenuloplanes niger TaxID=587534 RepID=A0AAE3ZUJ9_9ACTN|nr:M50 family metallopeptidase [Catenuloplanes niger]MDR7326152.1 Zn-dependent protease [Catenuloplanes niger]